jgi:predicted PurR-regulated permease PerM
MDFRESYRRSIVALMVLVVTVAFFAMMRKFVVPLVFAGIFSAILHPLYRRILRVARGRRTVAAVVTLVLVVLVVLLPFGAFVGVLVKEAVGVSNSIQSVQRGSARPAGPQGAFGGPSPPVQG